MSETMLALLALMITVFFTMTQQRGIVEAEREIASIELEVMANAVGSEMMQVIATKEFDAATAGADLQTVTLGELTPVGEFGDNLNCPSACDYIDDYHTMQTVASTYEVGTDEVGDLLEFAFEITAEVTYVDDSGAYSASPTWTKKVTIYVDQAVAEGEQRYLLQPISLIRQFSPQ